MVKCPHCGRVITPHERYCYHCELAIEKPAREFEKMKIPKPGRRKVELVPSTDAYCVKCRKKVTILNPKKIKMKNDRLALKGNCLECNTKVFRITGKA